MNLVYDAYEPCVMMDKTTVPDGRGGIVTRWVEGAPFRAAVIKDDDDAVIVAQAQGVTSIYIVTTTGGVVLQFHDVFKRVEDGKIFRVTTDGEDKKPPNAASAVIKSMSSQVRAEEWALPVGE